MIVIFNKKINGTFYVVEAVPITAKKTLFVTSAYINKKGAEQIPNAKSPEKTSETPPTITPTTNIPQKRTVVKGKAY